MQILLVLQCPMYNLIEYSDNCSDSSGSLWVFKRDEVINNGDVTNDNNGSLLKYKACIIGNTEANGKKWSKNSYTTKIFKQFLEIIRNATD